MIKKTVQLDIGKEAGKIFEMYMWEYVSACIRCLKPQILRIKNNNIQLLTIEAQASRASQAPPPLIAGRPSLNDPKDKPSLLGFGPFSSRINLNNGIYSLDTR